jgi:hypothetical protein
MHSHQFRLQLTDSGRIAQRDAAVPFVQLPRGHMDEVDASPEEDESQDNLARSVRTQQRPYLAERGIQPTECDTPFDGK